MLLVSRAALLDPYDPGCFPLQFWVSESTSTPQLSFKRPHIPSNRDHKALNRGTLGGLGICGGFQQYTQHAMAYIYGSFAWRQLPPNRASRFPIIIPCWLALAMHQDDDSAGMDELRFPAAESRGGSIGSSQSRRQSYVENLKQEILRRPHPYRIGLDRMNSFHLEPML